MLLWLWLGWNQTLLCSNRGAYSSVISRLSALGKLLTPYAIEFTDIRSIAVGGRSKKPMQGEHSRCEQGSGAGSGAR